MTAIKVGDEVVVAIVSDDGTFGSQGVVQKVELFPEDERDSYVVAWDRPAPKMVFTIRNEEGRAQRCFSGFTFHSNSKRAQSLMRARKRMIGEDG